MPEVKRQTAYKCSIKMIVEGNYIQRPGWDPNYIQANGLQISRINILAVAVNKEGNAITIDDGSGQIQVIVFGEPDKLTGINVGDVVQIIGRPREYNQKRFIVPEILKIVEDKKWIDYRKLELNIQNAEGSSKESQVKTSASMTAGSAASADKKQEENAGHDYDADQETTEEDFESGKIYEDNYASKIISAIRNLDRGEGANINDVIKQSGLDKAEKYIISLINEGEIFEIRTGKLKILE